MSANLSELSLQFLKQRMKHAEEFAFAVIKQSGVGQFFARRLENSASTAEFSKRRVGLCKFEVRFFCSGLKCAYRCGKDALVIG